MIREYLNYLALTKGFSASTISAYNNALGLFVEAMRQDGKRWSTISSDDVSNYLQQQMLMKSPATISQYISALRGIYKYMMINYELKENPMKFIVTPKQLSRTPHIVSIDEAKKALLAEPRWMVRLAVMVMLSTGLRVSEVRNMRYEDINHEDGRVLIVGKGQKERYVYLPMMLVEYLNKSEGIIFDVEDREFRYMIFNAFKRVGIYCSPHMLRHTYASMAIDRGMRLDVLRAVLGHSSLATTQIYLHTGHRVIREEMCKVLAL